MDTHFEERKRVHRKLMIFNQNVIKLLYIEMYEQREIIIHSWFKSIFCEQPSFHIGMGSSQLPRKFHEGHNDNYCDLPNTFLLDKFAFKSYSQAAKQPLMKTKLRVNVCHYQVIGVWVQFYCISGKYCNFHEVMCSFVFVEQGLYKLWLNCFLSWFPFKVSKVVLFYKCFPLMDAWETMCDSSNDIGGSSHV